MAMYTDMKSHRAPLVVRYSDSTLSGKPQTSLTATAESLSSILIIFIDNAFRRERPIGTRGDMDGSRLSYRPGGVTSEDRVIIRGQDVVRSVRAAVGLYLGGLCDGKPSQFNVGKDCRWLIVYFEQGIALTAQSLMTVSAVYGLGNHESVLSLSDIVKTNLWSWIAQILAIISLVVGRIAVISFLLILQQRTHPIGRRLLYAVGSLQGIINLVEVVLILKECTPIEKLWDPSVPGTCGLIKICSQVGFLQGSIGAFADLFLAFYPICIIAPLQQTRKVKIGLCLIMGGGLM